MNELVIHFVGLCLFLNNGPNTPVQVVMPKVDTAHTTLHHVDPHAAIIAVPRSHVVDSDNWTPEPLEAAGMTGYDVYRLNGEQVQFVGVKATQNARVPPLLPSLCGKRTASTPAPALAQGFRPPYPSAAAVVTIEHGLLTPCVSKAIDSSSRIDTRLTLQTRRSEITIKTATRELVVAVGADVLIANVPDDWIRGAYRPRAGSHLAAYYAMLEQTGSCNLELTANGIPDCDEALQDKRPQRPRTRNQLTSFGSTQTRIRPAKRLNMKDFRFMTSQCSNSQYP